MDSSFPNAAYRLGKVLLFTDYHLAGSLTFVFAFL